MQSEMQDDRGVVIATVDPLQTACAKCQYQLVGLGCDTQCPECAAPVKWSLRDNRLSSIGTFKLRGLLDAAWFLQLALCLKVVSVVLCVGAFALLLISSFSMWGSSGLNWGPPQITAMSIAAIPIVISTCLAIAAHWGLTDAVVEDRSRPSESRVAFALRWIGIGDETLTLGGIALLVALGSIPVAWSSSGITRVVSADDGQTLVGMSLLLWLLIGLKTCWAVLVARFLFDLSPRIPSIRLRTLAKVLQWIGPGLMLMGFVVPYAFVATGLGVVVLNSIALGMLRRESIRQIGFHQCEGPRA
jgi:hypothetical protein